MGYRFSPAKELVWAGHELGLRLGPSLRRGALPAGCLVYLRRTPDDHKTQIVEVVSSDGWRIHSGESLTQGRITRKPITGSVYSGKIFEAVLIPKPGSPHFEAFLNWSKDSHGRRPTGSSDLPVVFEKNIQGLPRTVITKAHDDRYHYGWEIEQLLTLDEIRKFGDNLLVHMHLISEEGIGLLVTLAVHKNEKCRLIIRQPHAKPLIDPPPGLLERVLRKPIGIGTTIAKIGDWKTLVADQVLIEETNGRPLDSLLHGLPIECYPANDLRIRWDDRMFWNSPSIPLPSKQLEARLLARSPKPEQIIAGKALFQNHELPLRPVPMAVPYI